MQRIDENEEEEAEKLHCSLFYIDVQQMIIGPAHIQKQQQQQNHEFICTPPHFSCLPEPIQYLTNTSVKTKM